MRRPGLAVALVGVVLSAGALAADDPADLAFWTSVRNSGNPAELQAYLATFPHGRFAELARIRLQALTATVLPTPALPATSMPTPNPRAAAVSLVPTKTRLRLIDPVVIDLDARALASGSNHRLAVVPAGTPDAIADPTAFANDSKGVPASRTRVSLPLSAPGPNEIRLYYIPQFGSTFVVAARASIEVEPSLAGAVLVSRLTREAGETDPVQFEAKYRDRAITVQGQFLRMYSTRVDQLTWSSLLHSAVSVDKPYVAMSLGYLGAEHRPDGPPTELLCLMSVDDHAVLDRVAQLHPGDAVVLQGTPSTWGAAFGSMAIIFNPCVFAPGQ